MADNDYLARLDAWRLELGILQNAFERVAVMVSDDSEAGAIAHVLNDRFIHLVESMPVPV